MTVLRQMFSGGVTEPLAGVGARRGQGAAAPALTSGPNSTRSGGVRCETDGWTVASVCPSVITPGLIVDTRLAHFSDEGAIGTNREGQLGQFTGQTIRALEELVKSAEQAAPRRQQEKDICGYCSVEIYFVRPPVGFVCPLDHPYREEFTADGGWWLHVGREPNLRLCGLFAPDGFKATPAPKKAVQ